MLRKIFCIFVSLFVSIISATTVCTNKSPCKCILSPQEVIDISSVGRALYPRFYEVRSNSETDLNLYSYNPCYNFHSTDVHTTVKSPNRPCKLAAACVRSPGGNAGELPEEHVIGVQSEGVFGNNTVMGFHINYTVPGAPQKLTVKLVCESNSSNETLIVETPETESNNDIVMKLNSKCACRNGCIATDPVGPKDEGMSTGSKLLIAFFTILLAYFIIGIVWNFFNGSQGVELLPNYEFWNELPKLIVEGLAFTFSCCGRKSSYGEV